MEQTTQLIELSQSNPGKKEYERKEVGGGDRTEDRTRTIDWFMLTLCQPRLSHDVVVCAKAGEVHNYSGSREWRQHSGKPSPGYSWSRRPGALPPRRASAISF